MDLARSGWLFSEEALVLKDFVPDKTQLFGQPVAHVTYDLFRQLMLAKIYVSLSQPTALKPALVCVFD